MTVSEPQLTEREKERKREREREREKKENQMGGEKRGGAAAFAAGSTMAVLGQGVLGSADRHGYVSALNVDGGSGDGAPVITSDVGVVPSGVSQGAVGRFLPRLYGVEGDGSPATIETAGTAFYLSTQSDACMIDVVS